MTELFKVRKVLTVVEETHHDFGPTRALPALKGAAMAVVTNPYVGHYVEDLSPSVPPLRVLGEELAARLIARMGCTREQVDGYGKAAIVGSSGEIEHGAMWHIPGGGMRAALGRGEAIVPS